MVMAWDDHDSGINDAGLSNPYKHTAKAMAADFYNMKRNDPRMNRDGLYRSYIFGPMGRRTQVILLDTRWFKSEYQCAREDCSTLTLDKGKERYIPSDSPQKTMLGEAQWEWLASRLKAPADLRLIVSSVQVLNNSTGWETWGLMPLEQQKLDAFRATKA